MRMTGQLSDREPDAAPPVLPRIRVAVPGCQGAPQAEFRRLIDAQPDMEIVADAPDALADVTVIDGTTPGTALVETIERIRRRDQSARLLVLTTDQEVLSAIRALPRHRPPLPSQCRRAPPRLLSPREREVLDLLVRGYANHEIAERLRVSVKTVETHRARMTRKLGVRTRADLVEYALLEGILALPPEPISDSA